MCARRESLGKHFADINCLPSDRVKQLIAALQLHPFGDLIKVHLIGCKIERFERRRQRFLAERVKAFLLAVANETTDCRPCAASLCQRFPALNHGFLVAANNVHNVAIAQLGPQRTGFAINAAALTAIADICVHRIGKIERHGAFRQNDQTTFRREGENVIEIHFELGVLVKFLRIRAVADHFSEGCQAGRRIKTNLRGTFSVKAVF